MQLMPSPLKGFRSPVSSVTFAIRSILRIMGADEHRGRTPRTNTFPFSFARGAPRHRPRVPPLSFIGRWWAGSQRQAFFGEVGTVLVVGWNLRTASRKRRAHPRSLNLSSPPAGCRWLQRLLGTGSKDNPRAASTLPLSTKIMDRESGVPADGRLVLPNFFSLRLTPPLVGGGGACVHGSPSSPPALPASTLV